MPLSERVRPGCEVAPCVISEIKQLEAEVERLHIVLAALREPSEAVLDAAANAPHEHRHPDVPTLAETIRAAVAAAEAEAAHDAVQSDHKRMEALPPLHEAMSRLRTELCRCARECNCEVRLPMNVARILNHTLLALGGEEGDIK